MNFLAARSQMPAAASGEVLFRFWDQPIGRKTDGLYVIDHLGRAGSQVPRAPRSVS